MTEQDLAADARRRMLDYTNVDPARIPLFMDEASHAIRIREQDQFNTPEVTKRLNKACRVRLILPGADGSAHVQFTCNKPKGHQGLVGRGHAETGRVRTKDGKVQTYTVTWEDSTAEVWRG